MIICVCRNLSDRAVRDAARAGTPLDALLRSSGAGSACGCCRFAIARAYADARDATAGPGRASLPVLAA